MTLPGALYAKLQSSLPSRPEPWAILWYLIPVKCRIEDRSFKSYIIDFSKVGAFIESNDRFPVGQKIIMAFKLPNHHQSLQLNGRIARSGPRGMGVKFYNLSPTHEDAILSFVGSKK